MSREFYTSKKGEIWHFDCEKYWFWYQRETRLTDKKSGKIYFCPSISISTKSVGSTKMHFPNRKEFGMRARVKFAIERIFFLSISAGRREFRDRKYSKMEYFRSISQKWYRRRKCISELERDRIGSKRKTGDRVRITFRIVARKRHRPNSVPRRGDGVLPLWQWKKHPPVPNG